MRAAFDRLAVEDRRIATDGDTALVTCRLVTRARGTGAVLDLPMVQVVQVAGARIVAFRPFYWNVPAYRAAIGGSRP